MSLHRRSAWRLYPLFVLGVAGIFVLSMALSILLSFGLLRLGLIDRNDEGAQVVLALLFIIPCLVIGLILTLGFGRAQVRPLDSLVSGMRRVAEGDFDVRLDEHRRGPLHDANVDFNLMVTQLAQTEMLRDDFVTNVSHEFRAPLATIQGYAALLADPRASDVERAEYAQVVMEATRRLTRLSSGVLELSRLTADADAPLDTKPIDLAEQLRHAVAERAGAWEAAGLSFDVSLREATIMGNEALLAEVWANLLENAAKFTPAGGTLRVSLGIEEGEAVVCVADTGRGMSPEEAAHCFDKFYQGDSSHATVGNGLGLALVRAVVERHGGTVGIESRLGFGSTFTVRLPLG